MKGLSQEFGPNNKQLEIVPYDFFQASRKIMGNVATVSDEVICNATVVTVSHEVIRNATVTAVSHGVICKTQ
jgi:hypothetical protein